jgi:xylan 1,4-beta-xylosidase
MYWSYTAASIARKHELAEKYGVNLEGALTWAFEFEDQPYFAGFRSLASNGIDKPVLNVFRMFSRMSGRRLGVESDASRSLDEILRQGVREKPDVSALASGNQRCLWVLVWHYHDDDLPGPQAAVELSVDGLPFARGEAKLEHFRIDEDHSNGFSAWKRMGSPQNPTPDQYAALENAGQLAALGPAETVKVENGSLRLRFLLPRQAVSLLALECVHFAE